MRVLLDEHLPVRLARALLGHTISTVRAEGWMGKKNGELLALAVNASFDVLITNDRSIEHQQDISKLPIRVLVLNAPSNNIEVVRPLAPQILERIDSIEPGEVAHLAG